MWCIAIQADNYGPGDASSPRWTTLLQEAGHEVRSVDVYRDDILSQVKGCRGFMWRWAHFGGMRRIAHRLLPVLEDELGMVVYPDQRTCWHYDDKIAQRYLLDAAGIPIPRTWTWFDRERAEQWAKDVEYPLVLKLFAGAGSTNVRLVESYREAKEWILRLFREGVYDLTTPKIDAEGTSTRDVQQWPTPPWNWRERIRAAAKSIIKGRPLGMPPAPLPHPKPTGEELHFGYALFQEFLPHNEFDTRITVIGNRAFGFRRFNRPGDFRASGSGRIDHAPEAIDERMIRLAFSVAQKLNTQSVAIDGLYRDRECVVGEISYTYASWAVHDCPGHWTLHGVPETGDLEWVEGQMWPEEAQIADFLARLEIAAQ